ncbi:MAG: transcriptional regulator [Pseudomonadales bacterium]|nr:transcriptional regulator [Pseudomonadales bacterium]
MNSVTITQKTHNGFGGLLRTWRQRRKRSQLDVSLDAGVSQRHLSFLESGRAKPSREMILQLAEVLEIPLREQNLLLNSAGFSSLYPSRPLDSEAMTAVRKALDLTLQHHEPYPAVVMDRNWNLLLQNQSAERFIGLLGNPAEIWPKIHNGPPNGMRLTFSPQGMQPLISNWPDVASMLLSRLQREVTADPANTELSTLFRDLCNLPSIPERWQNITPPTAPEPILPLELQWNGATLRIFSMISTFGTALDITADELRVETFFPVDEFTETFFRMLQHQGDH